MEELFEPGNVYGVISRGDYCVVRVLEHGPYGWMRVAVHERDPIAINVGSRQIAGGVWINATRLDYAVEIPR